MLNPRRNCRHPLVYPPCKGLVNAALGLIFIPLGWVTISEVLRIKKAPIPYAGAQAV